MVKTRQLSGFQAVVLYAVAAAVLAAVLIVTGWSDSWLYLLAGPVLLTAGFYPRRLYLWMLVWTVAAALAVVVPRDPHLGAGFRNVWFACGLILLNAEVLHRMFQSRLRAEAELRVLLEREQDARAQSQELH